MNSETVSASGAEDIEYAMKDVLTVRPRDRAVAFRRFQTAITAFLAAIDTAPLSTADRQARSERERFLRQAEVYLRALSTYSVTSEAWLNVFTAFKRMFDMHVFGRPRNDLMRKDPHSPYSPDPELKRYVRL